MGRREREVVPAVFECGESGGVDGIAEEISFGASTQRKVVV